MGKIIFKELDENDPLFSGKVTFSSHNSKTVEKKSNKTAQAPSDEQSKSDKKASRKD